MARKACLVVALLALTTGWTGSAQEAPSVPGSTRDARRVLKAAAAAMGTTNLRAVQYTAAGWYAAVGQSYSLRDEWPRWERFTVIDDWPRWEVADYTRTIDFGTGSLRDEFTRRRGAWPDRGGSLPGGPFQGDQRIVEILSEGFAWNMRGEAPVAQVRPYLDAVPVNELRQLEIMMTPHGFLKAAMAANPTSVSLTIEGPTSEGLTGKGGRLTLVAFEALGKYRIVGAINEKNLVELTQTWLANPVYGDMLYEIRQLEYRNFGGVMFPTWIHAHQGDAVFSQGHNSMDIRVSDVRTNVSVPATAVPDAIRRATVPPARAETQPLADGVWLVGGGSHNSLAVEFRDHMAVFEAPLNEARSLAVIEALKKLVPNKLIRYVVNTHHHFDHIGGLRTYVAYGTTLLTHESNRPFYDRVLFHPGSRTLQPDLFSFYYPNFADNRRPWTITEAVHGKYVLSDGTRTLELHAVQGNAHAEGMLMGYLPKERILINADLYSPGEQKTATAAMRTLQENIERLKLDVVQHVGIHGGTGSHQDFLKILGAEAGEGSRLP